MKKPKNSLGPLLAASLFAGAGSLPAAIILAEVDFSGTGGSAVGSIPSSNAQFTVKNSAIDFTSTTLATVGGGSSTAAWTIDGSGTAAANVDLFTSSTFGGPTRMDLSLGLATVGKTYTITSVELDIRAANTAATWEFGYRKSSDSTTVLVGAQTIATQSGANPITTYTIDLTGESLTATDMTSSWVLSGSGGLRWEFFESTGTGNDNFQVDAIRVIGTVIPEPSTSVLFGSLAMIGMMRRRR